ncbi:MAG: hypothetical protein JNK04_17175 [Myxococcales bacterium]|nr:hypothetical protein [Myxococcales bacterium]
MRLAVGFSCFALLACDPAPRDASTPDVGPAPSTTEAPPTERSSDGLRFPPLDDACGSDADCVLFAEETADAPPRTFTCCPGCTERAANKRWLAEFRAVCRGLSPPSCPPLGCAMPILRPTCQAGRCVASK